MLELIDIAHMYIVHYYFVDGDFVLKFWFAGGVMLREVRSAVVKHLKLWIFVEWGGTGAAHYQAKSVRICSDNKLWNN
jgi:hypothetical protein